MTKSILSTIFFILHFIIYLFLIYMLIQGNWKFDSVNDVSYLYILNTNLITWLTAAVFFNILGYALKGNKK